MTDLFGSIRVIPPLKVENLTLRLSFPSTRRNITLTRIFFGKSLTSLTLGFSDPDIQPDYSTIAKVLKYLPTESPNIVITGLGTSQSLLARSCTAKAF
ncbi:hypothetical protein BDP27DRAFT_1418280 [Rhodocollybia butyracea]|uniref:Uncharacterized protein n=1 Tax=Rhodocollybia butyracea TaxID=206335 RepID=A0A9P5UAL6_9AGAR|nr:hypothetical protein BDP27DRAFT_1418280 [Rhodocollybia butyracea]